MFIPIKITLDMSKWYELYLRAYIETERFEGHVGTVQTWYEHHQ